MIQNSRRGIRRGGDNPKSIPVEEEKTQSRNEEL